MRRSFSLKISNFLDEFLEEKEHSQRSQNPLNLTELEEASKTDLFFTKKIEFIAKSLRRCNHKHKSYSHIYPDIETKSSEILKENEFC